MNNLAEGDYVQFDHGNGEMAVGRVEYVMTNPGTLGLEESKYSIPYDENDKPIIVRMHDMIDGILEESPHLMYLKSSQAQKIVPIQKSIWGGAFLGRII